MQFIQDLNPNTLDRVEPRPSNVGIVWITIMATTHSTYVVVFFGKYEWV
jgi:hypothetical protein